MIPKISNAQNTNPSKWDLKGDIPSIYCCYVYKVKLKKLLIHLRVNPRIFTTFHSTFWVLANNYITPQFLKRQSKTQLPNPTHNTNNSHHPSFHLIPCSYFLWLLHPNPITNAKYKWKLTKRKLTVREFTPLPLLDCTLLLLMLPIDAWLLILQTNKLRKLDSHGKHFFLNVTNYLFIFPVTKKKKEKRNTMSSSTRNWLMPLSKVS